MTENEKLMIAYAEAVYLNELYAAADKYDKQNKNYDKESENDYEDENDYVGMGWIGRNGKP
jgi:exopolysaccharide biosynthesis predicted pyruvyltransferase EpsI